MALSEYISKKNLIPFTLILGMASDKLDDTLRSPIVELCSQAEKLIITPIPSPRTASPEMMEKFLDEFGALAQFPEIKYVNSAEEALEVSLDYREQPVVVAGSIYLVGLVLKILENRRGS
jgi:folylpolyglutamate synthase/dihydropteroate synthase